jgi:3-hydroxyisobutyrate dehydrogenase-like beta-hydroxyacid dehydrogenase
MQLGLVGLGKMGFNMRERLRGGGHEVVGYDPRPEVSDVPSLAALAEALTAPRVVWVMVPSGPITDETITALAEVLARATSWSTAVTPSTPRTHRTPNYSARRASRSSTPASPAGCGA